MHTTNQIQDTTSAGFAPAPAEAHPEANVKRDFAVDAELERCVSDLEKIWCARNREPLVHPTIATFWSSIRSDVAMAAIGSFNAHRVTCEWLDGDFAAIRQIARFDFAAGLDLYPQEFRDSDIACSVWEDGFYATEQCPAARQAAVAELDKYYALAMAN
ncbi:hypothetical protein [Massilia sp.]|uniref:hypothetical protein n=1 Tax=Massilia sp. TaxID=1882437 RepID=UPI00352D3064